MDLENTLKFPWPSSVVSKLTSVTQFGWLEATNKNHHLTIQKTCFRKCSHTFYFSWFYSMIWRWKVGTNKPRSLDWLKTVNTRSKYFWLSRPKILTTIAFQSPFSKNKCSWVHRTDSLVFHTPASRSLIRLLCTNPFYASDIPSTENLYLLRQDELKSLSGRALGHFKHAHCLSW